LKTFGVNLGLLWTQIPLKSSSVSKGGNPRGYRGTHTGVNSRTYLERVGEYRREKQAEEKNGENHKRRG